MKDKRKAGSKSSTRKPDRQVRTEADKQRDHERFLLVWESFVSIFKYFLVCGCIVFTGYVIFYLPVTVAPGKATIVSTTQKFLADINMHVVLAWGVAAASTGLYFRERNQKLQERQSKDSRIRQLELKIDPNVTSSNLNLDGTKELRRNHE